MLIPSMNTIVVLCTYRNGTKIVRKSKYGLESNEIQVCNIPLNLPDILLGRQQRFIFAIHILAFFHTVHQILQKHFTIIFCIAKKSTIHFVNTSIRIRFDSNVLITKWKTRNKQTDKSRLKEEDRETFTSLTFFSLLILYDRPNSQTCPMQRIISTVQVSAL